MDSNQASKLKDDLNSIKMTQEKLFDLGWKPKKYDTLIFVATLIGILAGLGGVIEVLYQGLTWEAAIFIAIGAFAFYKGNESDKAKSAIREEYHKNQAKIVKMEHEHHELVASLEPREGFECRLVALLKVQEEQHNPKP